jgi:hypothetical protein
MTKRAKNYYEIRFMTENGDYVFVPNIMKFTNRNRRNNFLKILKY